MNLDEKEFLIGMTGLISEYNTHFISINELISTYYMYTYLHINRCLYVFVYTCKVLTRTLPCFHMNRLY